ncbi:Aldo/keto reductase family [uncultured Clostridium sp.]|nr:Aldo/keto reductase family [uncultured Clostridium sp.]
MMERNIPIMAYCPMAQAGRLRKNINSNPMLKEIANSHGLSIIELLLCFVLQKNQIIAIPRTSNP